MKLLNLTVFIMILAITNNNGYSQVFQDDVMSEMTGTFPGKWEVVNGSAMVSVSPTGEKAIKIEHDGYIRPVVNGQLEGYLGEEFTISFKAYFNAEQYLGRQQYVLRLWNGDRYYGSNTRRMNPIVIQRNGAITTYFNPDQKNVSKYFPTNTPENLYDPNTKTFLRMWRTIRLTYQGGDMTLFIDDNLVLLIPNMPLQPTMFSVGAIEGWRQVKDYFTAIRDVVVYNSANPEPSEIGCDALRMELIDGYWRMFWDPADSEDAPIFNINGNEGIVLRPGAYTASEAGSVFWKNIRPIDDTYYQLEQANGGNGIPLKIKRLNIDEFGLKEYRENGDSIQTVWQRLPKYYEVNPSSPGQGSNNGDIGSGEWPKIITDSFHGNRILENGPEEVDYIVQSNKVIDISARVIINPGVVIEFEENSGFGIYDDGSLSINGTQEDPIILRGRENVKGYWRGIHYEGNGGFDNRIDHVKIKNAGSNYIYCCNEKASIFLKHGYLNVSNTTIENGRGCGIHVEDNLNFHEEDNTFINIEGADVCMED